MRKLKTSIFTAFLVYFFLVFNTTSLEAHILLDNVPPTAFERAFVAEGVFTIRRVQLLFNIGIASFGLYFLIFLSYFFETKKELLKLMLDLKPFLKHEKIHTSASIRYLPLIYTSIPFILLILMIGLSLMYLRWGCLIWTDIVGMFILSPLGAYLFLFRKSLPQ